MRQLLTRLLLAAALALGAAACGGGGDDSSAPDTSPGGGGGETITSPAETGGGTEEVLCSASAETGVELTEQELPAPVAEMREKIFAAATACDYEELERLALEQGEGFSFTFGDPAGGPAAFWRRQEEEGTGEPMYALTTILTLPVTRNEAGSYAWPSAYNEKPTDADWQALVDAFLYTPAEVDQMKSAGSYTGWRTAITPEGDWQFFTAGD